MRIIRAGLRPAFAVLVIAHAFAHAVLPARGWMAPDKLAVDFMPFILYAVAVTGFTALGIVLSLASHLVVAAVFGAGPAMDAYLAATTLPLLLGAVLTGTLAATFLPAYSEALERDPAGARRLAGTYLHLAVGAALLLAGLFARVGRRLGLPTIPFFIVAGIVFGPQTPGIVVLEDPHEIELLAMLGLVLLLFHLGIEFSLDDLLAGGRRLLWAGGSYIGLNFGVGIALGFLLGWGTREAFVIAGMIGTSSTAIVTKLLSDLNRLANRETGMILGIIVVEDVSDLWALERAGALNAAYHVLGGTLSPLDGVGPDDLNIKGLVQRVANGGVRELIIAVNATVEGQTTAHYITDQLEGMEVKITRLAHGVPVGGELDYLDEGTLAAALRARTSI